MTCLAGCHGPASQLWKTLPITSSPEALAGLRAAPAVEARFGGVVRDADAERRMERVGRRIGQGAPEPWGGYRYRLLDSDRVNAVSLPGGRIYITRALYAPTFQ